MNDPTILAQHIRDLAPDDVYDGTLFIYDQVDSLLSVGKFDVVDHLLTEDFSALSVTLALLSITLPAFALLSNRESFARRVRERLEREEPDRVERLLVGLE